MRRLHPLNLLQSPPAQLARLHRRVAVLGEVFAWRGVVVESNGHLGETRAQRAVSVEPVCEREGGGVVGWLVAGGGLEAEEGEDGRCHGLV